MILFNMKTHISGIQSFMYICVCISVCICVNINSEIMLLVILIDTGRCYAVFQVTEPSIELPICDDCDHNCGPPDRCYTEKLTFQTIWRNSPKCTSLGRWDEGKKNKINLSLYLCSICILSCLCASLVIF